CKGARPWPEARRAATALMMPRIQQARTPAARLPGTRAYAPVWGLNAGTMERWPPRPVELHPGPVNRGVELSSEVMDGEGSLVMDQVDSGVAVRMATLALCLGAA